MINMGNKKMKLESKSEQQNMLKKNSDLKNINFRPLSTLNTAKLLKNQQEVIESSESSNDQEDSNIQENS